MISSIGLLAVALGWSLRHGRPRSRRRGVPRGQRARERLVVGVASWARRARGPGAPADPAPLLRFRTAIGRGASVLQAFDSVAAGSGPWATGAGRLVRRARAGARVQDALDAWVVEEGEPSLRLLADALAISSATGGSHVRAVDAVIEAVRARAALQREVRALASQAQTSAVVLLVLPVAFAVAAAMLDDRVRHFYVGSPWGPVCVLVGCTLDAIGGWLMLRLVRAVR